MRQDKQQPELAFSTMLTRNESIVYTELDDSIVMMDVDKGRYYELNPIGARIWTLLETQRSIADICESLVAEYEVDRDTCQTEALEFLHAGYAKQLFVVRSDRKRQ